LAEQVLADTWRGLARRVALGTGEYMPQQINLYNAAFEEQRARLSFKSAVIGWTAVTACVAAWAANEVMNLQAAEKQNRELTSQISAAQAEIPPLASRVAGRKQSEELTAEITKLEKEVLGRQDVMAVLQSGRLGDTRGFSEHLKAFARQSFEGVWLTGLEIGAGGRDVVMEGRALQPAQVAGYLKRLNAESLMQGHPFAELLIQLPKSDPGAKTEVRPRFVEFRLATQSGPPAEQKAGAR